MRAVGPGLAAQGVSDPITDPKLTLIDANHRIVATNDNWSEAANATQAGAFALASSSHDAAALVTLEPGVYTMVVEGMKAPKASRSSKRMKSCLSAGENAQPQKLPVMPAV